MATAWFTMARLLAARLAEVDGYAAVRDVAGLETDVAVFLGADWWWLGRDEPRDKIIVAYCGESEDEATSAGGAKQARGPISSTVRPRDEVGIIAVRIVATTRGAVDATVRVEQIVTALETVVRQNPTLGGGTALNMAHLTEILDPIIDSAEATSVQVDATIEYQARI